MGLLDKLDKKLASKGSDPLGDILNTPKHKAGGDNIPLTPDDITDEIIEENIFTIDESEVKEELDSEDNKGIVKVETSPSLRAERRQFMVKQARRVMRRIDDLQLLLIELVLDIEETEEFKFTEDEINDVLESLPDVMEENQIELPPSWDLGISIAFMILKRIRRAYRIKRDKKLAMAA